MASILLPIQCWRRSSLIQTEGARERATVLIQAGKREFEQVCVCVQAREHEWDREQRVMVHRGTKTMEGEWETIGGQRERCRLKRTASNLLIHTLQSNFHMEERRQLPAQPPRCSKASLGTTNTPVCAVTASNPKLSHLARVITLVSCCPNKDLRAIKRSSLLYGGRWSIFSNFAHVPVGEFQHQRFDGKQKREWNPRRTNDHRLGSFSFSTFHLFRFSGWCRSRAPTGRGKKYSLKWFHVCFLNNSVLSLGFQRKEHYSCCVRLIPELLHSE